MQFNDNTDEQMKILTDLGLTVSQAKVYLALCESGQSSAKIISHSLSLDRANIYRLITKLQTIGLVERRLTAKKDVFVALPLKDGIQFLVDRKKDDFKEIQDNAHRLVRLLKEKKSATAKNGETVESFDLVPQGEANYRAFLKGLGEAQSSIDDVINWDGFGNAMLHSYPYYYEALKRGITIRYVTNVPEKSKVTDEIFLIVKKLRKMGVFQIRAIEEAPSSVFAVFDRTKTCICTAPTPNPLKTPALWSNNQTLANLAQKYFDSVWASAKSIDLE